MLEQTDGAPGCFRPQVQLPWGGRVLRAKEDEDGGSDDDSPTDDTSECKKYKSGNASLALCVLEAKGYQSEVSGTPHTGVGVHAHGRRVLCDSISLVVGPVSGVC